MADDEGAVTLREVKFKGDGAGKTFRTGGGDYYNVRATSIAGAANIVRIVIEQVGKDGKRLAGLGYSDISWRPGQDVHEKIMAEVRHKIGEAAVRAPHAKKVRDYLAKEWGVE
jgi:hypothetical protein